MRVLFGIISSCCYAPSVSLIRDYFPYEKRALANSIFSSYFYLGSAISSLSTLLIKNFGWRTTYDIISIFGVSVGFICFAVLYEPRRKE
jgi:MFS family permease